MELSERERRLLEQIESDLQSEHPDLASSLRTGKLGRWSRLRSRGLEGRVLATFAYAGGLLVGFGLLYLGLSLVNGLGTALALLGWMVLTAVSHGGARRWQGIRAVMNRLSSPDS
jgi:hypothetical protein